MLTREDVVRVDRERRSADTHRRLRVEILGLPWCRTCGGATDHTDDPELVCVCERRKAELQDRLARIAGDHMPKSEPHWLDRDRETG